MHAVKLPYQKYRHMLQSTARHSLWQEQGQATQAARFTRFTRKGLQSKRFCYEHTGSKDRASALVGEHQRKTLWSRQNSIKRKGWDLCTIQKRFRHLIICLPESCVPVTNSTNPLYDQFMIKWGGRSMCTILAPCQSGKHVEICCQDFTTVGQLSPLSVMSPLLCLAGRYIFPFRITVMSFNCLVASKDCSQRL